MTEDAQAPESEETAERLPPPDEAPATLIETVADLEAFCVHVAAADAVALDTEANSMHAYRERTCIVQLTVGPHNAIVDVVAVEDLTPLREALDRDVEIMLHGGDYDITVLTRDHDFRFHRVFDTMIAATLLSVEKVGLANLVEGHFGHQLDKRFQRADWARRPLSDEQLDYLQRDTIYLPALRRHLGDRLEDAGLTEVAGIEFARLARRRGTPLAFDEDAWRRIKGAAGLSGRGRAVLHALFLWREQAAERRDRPPFKVLSPHVMVGIAKNPPSNPKSPADIPLLGRRDRGRNGRAILRALQRGLEAARRGQVPEAKRAARLTSEEAAALKRARKRGDRLRLWRRDEAKRREVPNVVVLPNPALEWIAREEPRSTTDLEACVDIGPQRITQYGERYIAVAGGQTEGEDQQAQ